MGIWSRISEVVRHVFDARNAKRFSAKPFSVFNFQSGRSVPLVNACKCPSARALRICFFNSPLQGVVPIDVFVTLVLFGFASSISRSNAAQSSAASSARTNASPTGINPSG